jgi:ribosomal protein S18 acetylase RimI-like enzyme
MGHSPLRLRCATEHDHDAIIGLIDKAAEWLRTKNTDQWAQPWPSEEDRSHRILRDLRSEKTWLASDGAVPVATITADPEDSPVWPKDSRQERAVYVCRLVVSRTHEHRKKHKGLGAALLNWAGLRAREQYGARWIRVDVWTTNKALHDYYRQQGFEFRGFSEELADYPSTALFQKPTGGIEPSMCPPFSLIPQGGG